MKSDTWGLHWFRRDLRISGNSALRWNWSQSQGRVLGIFCFDSVFLSRPDFSVNRFAFFLKTLQALKADLVAHGGDLLVLDDRAQNAFPALFARLQEARVEGPRWVSWSRDYEPFARERDRWAETYFEQRPNTQVHTARDHLLIEPEDLVNESSTERAYYSVYTPFSRKWFEIFQRQKNSAQARAPEKTLEFRIQWKNLFETQSPPHDSLDETLSRVMAQTTVPIPEAGHVAAVNQLRLFSKKIDYYLDRRDFPSRRATSGLSIYLKNGSLTSAEIIAELQLDRASIQMKDGKSQYLKELIWREFYYHILWHRPDVEHQSFNPIYRQLKWPNREDWFTAWREGQTGYPIVDAGMRQLKQTGLMHNRVRMIVASFLTKDLLIDWRLGERYFMEKLLDGDLAPNNGGWQWAASTGCDPQPYFRVFNPELQSQKFDPDGSYIRQYVPELSHLDSGSIHAPSPMDRMGHYPLPIVDHAEQRNQALRFYKKN